MPRRKPIAVIDVGSNGLTMTISEVRKDGHVHRLETVRGNLALGIDTYNDQEISPEATESLIHHLRAFTEKLKEYQIVDYRVVATSAIREAENRDYLLAKVRHAVGMEIQILSNSEERYYHHLALSEGFEDFASLIEDRSLLLDMGAGSIQISGYEHGATIFSENLRLGYLRISELFSDMQNRSRDFPRIMDEYIGAQLTSVLRLQPDERKYKHVIATGSELAYLGRIIGKDTRKDPYLNAEEFQTVFRRLLNTQPIQLTTELGIPAEVAELLLPAAMILNKYIIDDRMEGVYLPMISLCEGVLIAMAEDQYGYKVSYDHREDLLETARQLAIRYRSNHAHTKQVSLIAQELFRAMRTRFKFNDRDQLILQLMTTLFDIGVFIDTTDSFVHTRNVILVSELIGLSKREQETLAYASAFAVREELKVPSILESRSQAFREKVLSLSGILRMAIALDASRTQKVEHMQAKLRGNSLQIVIETSQNFELEMWAISRRQRLLEEMFAVEPEIRIRNPLMKA